MSEHKFFGFLDRPISLYPHVSPRWYRDRQDQEYRIRFTRRKKNLCIKCGQARNPESRSFCDKHLDYIRERGRRLQGFKGKNTGRPHYKRSTDGR